MNDRVFMLLTNQKTINFEKIYLPKQKGYETFCFCECKGTVLLNNSSIKIHFNTLNSNLQLLGGLKLLNV